MKKKTLLILSIIALVVLLGVYFFLRIGCGNQIKFEPAEERSNFSGGFGGRTEEYYSYLAPHAYDAKKFKSKSEAVDYCTWNRLGF
jgi:hypothetical protein